MLKKLKTRILRMLKSDQDGMILVLVMSFMALIILSTVSLSTMVQRDVRLIQRIKEKEEARLVAEAGINHALAKLKADGFSSRADFSGALDTGTYDVTYTETAGRHLITSVGTVSGISETVTAEIRDTTPTALNYFTGAGNDIWINSLITNATVEGDIHANNNVYLRSGFLISWLRITGDVSATGIVVEGTVHDDGSGDLWDDHVVINGMADDTAVVFEGEDRIIFPTFDYDSFKDAAIASGDYYNSDQTFNNVALSPANGIVYVDGDARFEGNCTINGGVIADNITVIGDLIQQKSGDRNVIIAKEADISIFGELEVEEALVYAARDIRALQIFARIEVDGIMLAGRDFRMWNFITDITYRYVSPEGMVGVGGEDTFVLVSWNK